MPLHTIIMSDIVYNTPVGRKMRSKSNIKNAEKVFLYYYLMLEIRKNARKVS